MTTQLMVLGMSGRTAQLSTDYWEELGASRATDFYFFFFLSLPEDGTSDWHVLRLTCQGRGGKEGLSVFVGVLRTFGF